MTSEATIAKIKQQIKEHPVLLYMKGTPEQPRCGFSAQVVRVLRECEAPFVSIDVLENPDIRRELPVYANWPTFPQLYAHGELIGGCDIVLDLHAKGKLKDMLLS